MWAQSWTMRYFTRGRKTKDILTLHSWINAWAISFS